jgi:hydroxymethylbilane synthase
MTDTVRLGTRGSPLAMAQATTVAGQLRDCHPGLDVQIQVIKTRGDQVQDRPLHQVGGTGLFTREIERALIEGEVDVAVHSLKDLPALMRPGLALGAVPEREDARDVLICPDGHGLDELPRGACVATGALRRRVQLLEQRPDLKLTGMRGNLDTRLRKVHELPEIDATLVGAAGLSRMGWLDRATVFLDPERFVPAGGQGALGIQIRAGDERMRRIVEPLNHASTERRTAAERAFLARLEAGCQVPVAVHGRLVDGELVVDGMVGALDADPVLRDRVRGAPGDAEALGEALAERLLAAGGDRVLANLRLDD